MMQSLVAAGKRTAGVILLVALSLGGPLSCGSPDSGVQEALPLLEDLNVLMIVIDTLAVEHLGCFDSSLDTSPNIDRLARGGVNFRRAFSTAPWTQPAVASLFTSQMPSDNKVMRIFDKLPAEAVTLAEELHRRGFRARGVSANMLVTKKFGFGQGFEFIQDSPVAGHSAITSQRVTTVAKVMLDQLADSRFFLYVHYFDPHWYFNHHEEFDRTSEYKGRLRAGMDIGDLRSVRDRLQPDDIDYLVGLYREEIAFTDHHVGKLLDHLDKLNLDKNTLVILTADHGEEFMRHGWLGHTATLYDELIHVPLIFYLPGKLQPKAIDAPVSIMDIAPTLLAMSSRSQQPPSWQGKSLLGALDGSRTLPEDRPLFAEVNYVSPEGWPSGDGKQVSYFKTSLQVADWKLIHDMPTASFELYDLHNDPEELASRWDAPPPAGAALQDRLHTWEDGRIQAWKISREDLPDIDPETIEKLRSLGYVD